MSVTTGSVGRTLVISGPDGTGKSTAVAALLDGPLRDTDVMRIHHRPRLLPGRSTSEGSDQPHSSPPYPGWLGWVKVAYLYLDYLLGWMFRVRPHVRRGGWVLIERGWWDLVVDPSRYRLPSARPALLMDRLLPKADRTVVLSASVETIEARKAELGNDELQRQLDAWRARADGDRSIVLIDASRPVDEVASDIFRAAEAR